MKKTLIFALMALMLASCGGKKEMPGAGREAMPFAFGEALPAPPFSGEAYIHPMVATDTVFNFPATNCITFALGAHSQWHRHGAMVVVGIAGIGLYQAEGQEPRLIYPGDVVEIPDSTRHFHGAVAGSWFQQYVIYDAAWQPTEQTEEDNTLTDGQYAALMPKEIPVLTPHADGLVFAPADTMLSLPNFNGPIRLSNVLEGDNVAHCPGMHYVVFEPGVINAWHSHPGGQILLITDGVGYHQIEGQPVEVLHPGDVVMCPPDVKHWHGAAPGSRFAHLAAGTNPALPAVVWPDEILSKEEYNKLPQK